MEDKNNEKPNGFQWFTLGFVICTLLVQIIKIIKG